jgi:hypothetical protein
LGLWTDSEPTIRFFYSPRLDCVIERSNDQHYKYSFAGTGRRRRVCVYGNKGSTYDIPADLQRATVQMVDDYSLRLENSSESLLDATIQQQKSTREAFCEFLPEQTRWILEHFHMPADNGLYIAESIRSHSCIAVSDGSYEPNLCTGAAATTIQGASSYHAIRAECVTPATKSVQGSYRSELAGLYQTVVSVHVLCKHYAITDGTVDCMRRSSRSKGSSKILSTNKS